MFLDYSKLEFDIFGRPEKPELLLKTMAGDTIGVIPCVHNLRFNIKFSEPSEMTFDISATIDGVERNPMYDEVCGYRVIYTKHYGIYVIMNPESESDGIKDVKSVRAYSIETILETKRFFLEEGTFKFYNPVNQHDENTIIGRILEIASEWSIDYVSPAVAQRYRTFDQYDDYLLSFVYDSAPEKFRCVFVFEPYEKKISVYDADEERSLLPIYLDFDNLVTSIELNEQSDDLRTAMRPYGADGLDIRSVNPIGTNWLYDISYFIENGDIPADLAKKWQSWQKSVLNNQTYYKGLVALEASASARKLTEQAKLTDLNGELDSLIAQQSITIQAQAMEKTETGKQYQQELLAEINKKIKAKEAEIASKKNEIDRIDADISDYGSSIRAVIDQLAIRNYFTDDEYIKLSKYFIETDLIESTFVATSVDTSVSGQVYSVEKETLRIVNSAITRVDMTDKHSRTMYVVSGGTFSFSGSHNVSGDVIRGTMEVSSNNSFVLSLYAGGITINGVTAVSGLITVSGTMSGLSSDISAVTVDEVTTYEGTRVSFSCASGDMYLTADVSEYQRYSVQMELFDYAVSVLSDLAVPTYEFSIGSGNFLFEQNFAPYRKNLELGSGVYLNLGNERVITPLIIEIEFEFEDYSKFEIIFSNRFKRYDECNTLKEMVEKSYSSSRTLDANKYIYNQTADQATMVSDFMKRAMDAAVNTINAARNQSVVINGNGINIGGDGPYQIRIVDRMIAMTDDNWETAKVAIGLVSTDETGTQFVVNAEVVGGKLIIGNNLILENPTDNGVMQFKVDASGAWLYNATFVLQSDNVSAFSTYATAPLAATAATSGGKIILDPKYGIVAGGENLFTTSGTTVTPSFIDNKGGITLDSDGIPTNANFFLDIRDGNAYFRGRVKATSGLIGGFTLESDYMHSGSGGNYVAMNGSGTNTYSAYAFWAGASNPASAPFWIKKDGSFKATNGTFSGILSAARLSGNLTVADGVKDDDGWLIGCGINVGNKNFYVDRSGNVTMSGNINMKNGSITWGTSNSPVRVLYARTQLSTPTSSYASYPASSSTGWHQNHSVLYDYYASYSYDGGNTWTSAIKIKGEDGSDGHDGRDGSDATVNERNVFNVLTNGGTKFGIFGNSTANTLYINANYIQTGTLNANYIELSCSYGGFCKGYGSTGTRMTYGSMMYGSAGAGNEPYFLVTNAGCRMSAIGADFYVAENSIVASDEISIGSDRRIKESIEYDMSKYEEFFMALRPTQYKMKSGTSGRYHIGLIAQDVERALHDTGLSAQDFAGLTIEKLQDGFKKYGIADEFYQLRYGEFISLNTYMIQKLYRRMEALELKLNSMS